MRAILTLLLLPIVFPVSLVVWVFRSIFGPKTVPLDGAESEQLRAQSEWFRLLATDYPDADVKAQLEEIAECVQRVSGHEVVKKGALDDYRRNVRNLREMNLTGRTGMGKFVWMVFLLRDSAGRLEVK